MKPLINNIKIYIKNLLLENYAGKLMKFIYSVGKNQINIKDECK